jgi:hypothetical protein
MEALILLEFSIDSQWRRKEFKVRTTDNTLMLVTRHG